MATQTLTAKAELEDLEVREVSVVDHPANKKRFLIIKRDQEIPDMAKRAAPADEAKSTTTESVVDILDLVRLSKQEEGKTALELIEPVLKSLIDTIGAITAVEEGDLPSETVEQATKVAKAIGELANFEKIEVVEKVSDSAAEALDEMTAAVSAIREMDGEGSLSADIYGLGGDHPRASVRVHMAKAAGLLMGAVLPEGAEATIVKDAAPVAESDATPVADAAAAAKPAADAAAVAEVAKADAVDQTVPKVESEAAEVIDIVLADEDEEIEIFKSAKAEDGGDDPVIMIKRGAKMKSARLSKFKKAIDSLSEILSELGGGEAAKVAKVAAEKVAKAEAEKIAKSDESNAKIVEAITALSTKVDERFTALETSTTEVAKRVETIESARPAGEGDNDVPHTKVNKKADDEWSATIGIDFV